MRALVSIGLIIPAVVQADLVKPRITLAYDTSGSMAFEACDLGGLESEVDHAVECTGVDVPCLTCGAAGCGNGIADDGRLWKVKGATTNVVSAFGEIQFALARFHQNPQDFACKAGGWSGSSGLCGGAPLGSGENAGDILVPFAPNNDADLLEWVDYQDNYAGTPPASGCSLCPDCGGGCDKELRPAGGTPVGGLLRSVHLYLNAARSMDPRVGCRPYGVILLTDGANNCPDPVTNDLEPSPEEAASLCASGVPVYVIGFASPGLLPDLTAIADAGCGPACDDLNDDGVADCNNQAIVVDNETDLALAMADIIQASIRTERCNGMDDDCDDLTDEDFPSIGLPCGIGQCAGAGCCDVSDPSQTTETCCGGLPSTEVCDGQDNDCDGLTDEFPLVCMIEDEVCDGEDNDLDGQTDESPLADDGFVCGTEVGECISGLTCCTAGVQDCCFDLGPVNETCNCKDDDCNGLIDDGGGDFCWDPPGPGCDPVAGTCEGLCVLGQRICLDLDPGPACMAGAGPCVGQLRPQTEICNCLDDNCNGMVDDDAVCANGGRCENCACPAYCNPCTEFPCPSGQACECGEPCDCSDGGAGCFGDCFCQNDPCIGRECAECEFCDATMGGACRALCENLACDPWEECRCDACVDVSCTNPAESECGEGEVCDPAAHACVPDPCSGVDCGRDEYCVGGKCLSVCPQCPEGERCVDGRCVADPCANLVCGEFEVCCDGTCFHDPCTVTECGSGERCEPCTGSCVPDLCAIGVVTCPQDFVCRLDSCVHRSAVAGPRFSAGGAGGCECRMGDAPGPWWPALVLLLLLRRRR